MLRRYASAWPRVDLQLRESSADADLLAAVERGELDITFADQPLIDGPFESVELLRDPYVLLVQAGLAARGAQAAADARGDH